MPRGRETDEQALQRVEQLFFEIYTGTDCVKQGFKVTIGGCRQHWQDSPESTTALYRSALKTWLEYCDLLRRINPAATNAPWPDTKVRFYFHLLPHACPWPCPAPVHSCPLLTHGPCTAGGWLDD